MPHAVSRYWPAILAAGLLTLGGCTDGPPREKVSREPPPRPRRRRACRACRRAGLSPRQARRGRRTRHGGERPAAGHGNGPGVLQDGGNAVDAAWRRPSRSRWCCRAPATSAAAASWSRTSTARATRSTSARPRPAAGSRDMYLDAQGETGERSVTGHSRRACRAASRDSGRPIRSSGQNRGRASSRRRFASRKTASRWTTTPRPSSRPRPIDWPAFPRQPRCTCRRGAAHARHAPQEPRSRAHAAPHRRAGARRVLQGRDRRSVVAEMKRGKGIITARDLEGYEAKWRTPIAFQYRGHEVISMPPPSSGGLTLALIAGQLSAYDLASLGWHTAKAVHLMAESHAACVRRAQRGARRSRFRHLRSGASSCHPHSAPRCARRSRPTTPRRRARCRAGPRLRRAGRPRTSPSPTAAATPSR